MWLLVGIAILMVLGTVCWMIFHSVTSFWITVLIVICVAGVYCFIKFNDKRRMNMKKSIDRWLGVQICEKYGEQYVGFQFKKEHDEQRMKVYCEAIIRDRNGENKTVIWQWISSLSKIINIEIPEKNKEFKTKLSFEIIKNKSSNVKEWLVVKAESQEKNTGERLLWPDVVQKQILMINKECETDQQREYKRSAAWKAFHYYSYAYELDDSFSDIMVDFYRNGIGTAKDEDKVDEILERSARNGGVTERYKYAKYCLDKGMETRANEWFEAALASQNSSEHKKIVEEIRRMYI